MNKISRTLLSIAAVSALSIGFAFAQVGSLNVSIPFAFTAGKAVLPAGDYTIEPRFGSPVVFIRNLQNRETIAILAQPNYGSYKDTGSKVVFRVHGDKHYLASTWIGSTGTGRQFMETSDERKVEMASGQTNYTTLLARR